MAAIRKPSHVNFRVCISCCCQCCDQVRGNLKEESLLGSRFDRNQSIMAWLQVALPMWNGAAAGSQLSGVGSRKGNSDIQLTSHSAFIPPLQRAVGW